MKIGHGFFKPYLVRLSAYESNRCNGDCNEIKTPEHLLLNRRHFLNEQKEMKKNMKIPVTIYTLFNTSEGIKNVLNFIKNTRICTRKWILGTVEDEEVHEGGWGDLE